MLAREQLAYLPAGAATLINNRRPGIVHLEYSSNC